MSVTAKQRVEANLSGSAVLDQLARFEDGTLDEMDAVIEDVRATNEPGFGRTADHLSDALNDVRETTKWLLEQLAAGNNQMVLAGATPFQTMFGLVSGGVGLAKGGLAQAGRTRENWQGFMQKI